MTGSRTEVLIIIEGEIIKLVPHRGYGFIETEEVDQDVFFHFTGLENVHFEDLSEGDTLKFELNSTTKGPEATDITLVNETTTTTESDGESEIDNENEPFGW